MKLSTRSRYALRLMIDLARHDAETGYVSLKDISQRQGISVKYLEQIVTPLSRGGLVLSTRGAQGGYRLAKRPGDYTTGDIIRAIEGNLAPVACLGSRPNRCQRAEHCETLPFWEGLHRVIGEYLDSITLADLVNPPSPA